VTSTRVLVVAIRANLGVSGMVLHVSQTVVVLHLHLHLQVQHPAPGVQIASLQVAKYRLEI